jgi:hypothetical protein
MSWWLGFVASASEGMWSPEQLTELGPMMAEEGVKIPPAEMADLARGPLAAVVSLGGCTASFVSPDGLLMTNHHCVAGYLQGASDAENDRYTNGFVAPNRAGEISAGPTARAWLIEHSVDVTDTIVGGLKGKLSDAARADAIEAAIKREIAACESDGAGRVCEVSRYYGGLRYRMDRAVEIRDLRLVFAPPASVGDYGGEIDNFQWPRHAGDYSFLRAYVAPDGSSAAFDPANVPYKPTRYGKVDPTGVSEGEAIWVAGFPGNTERYATVWEVRPVIEVAYPLAIVRMKELVALLEGYAAAHPELAGKVLPQAASIGNGLKYRQGVLASLAGVDLVGDRQAAWDQLVAWANADKKRAKAYLPALEELASIERAAGDRLVQEGLIGWFGRFARILSASHQVYRWSLEQSRPDAERDPGYQERDRADVEASLAQVPRVFVPGAERLIVGKTLEWYDALPAAQRVPALDAFLTKHGGASAAVDALYAAADPAAPGAAFGQSPEQLRLSSDPWMQLAIVMEDGWYAAARARSEAEGGARSRVQPVVMEAMLAASTGNVYPDANGTLRVTFGKVEGYRPRDGLVATPFTSVAGMVAKHGAEPFVAPQPLRDAAATSAKSPYVMPALGDVPVDFLSTVDTTGGNSGSPTYDAEGRVVGALFDGVFESIASDYVFMPDVTRSIHVDIRYILWSLDALGGHAVVEELLAE